MVTYEPPQIIDYGTLVELTGKIHMNTDAPNGAPNTGPPPVS
jgi:hypothetical protein